MEEIILTSSDAFVPIDDDLLKFAFDPEKHPRQPKGTDKGGEFAPDEQLSPKQILDDIISDATRAVSEYVQNTHIFINNYLRGKGFGSKPHVSSARAVDAMDKAFDTDKAHYATKKDEYVYRYMAHEPTYKKLRRLKRGDTFSDKAYLSTSENRDLIYNTALSWSSSEGTVMLYVKTPKGTKYLKPYRRDEKERILNRGLKLKVDKIEDSPRDKRGGFNGGLLEIYAHVTK